MTTSSEVRAREVPATEPRLPSRGEMARLVVVGAAIGLAWSASLRSYMTELAGSGSRVDWAGTFVGILLPGVIVGALFGAAEAIRRSGGRRGWRWLAAAPLLFAVAVLAQPGALVTFLTTGIGGASLYVPIVGMIGGYALSSRGPTWVRIVLGIIVAASFPLMAVAQTFIRPILAFDSPRGAWVALLLASLMAVFIVACSIPHRKVRLVA